MTVKKQFTAQELVNARNAAFIALEEVHSAHMETKGVKNPELLGHDYKTMRTYLHSVVRNASPERIACDEDGAAGAGVLPNTVLGDTDDIVKLLVRYAEPNFYRAEKNRSEAGLAASILADKLGIRHEFQERLKEMLTKWNDPISKDTVR